MNRASTSVMLGSIVLLCTSASISGAGTDRATAPSTRSGSGVVATTNPATDRPTASGAVRVDEQSLRVEAPLAGPGVAMLPARRLAPMPHRRLTVAFAGDTLAHSPVVQHAWSNGAGTGFDFRPIFARVAPIIGAADLAICHLETPVAPPGQPLSTFPLYGVPAEIAAGIASAGYDRCSTASNHSLDRGTAGIDATVAALEMNGLGQSGMARSPDEVTAPVVTVAGIAVAHLSYTYGFNGLALPAAEPWRANPIDPVRIVADALDARVRGAEIVIVSLHWGVEKVVAPTAYQREVAATITASGAVDLIVGHHAHVLQPIEVINGRWVVFGLGNSLSNMPTGDSWPASTQDGAVLTVTIEQQPDGSLAVQQPVVIPTWVDRDGGFVIRPVLSDLADPSVSDGVKAELAASLARTTAVLGPFIATT